MAARCSAFWLGLALGFCAAVEVRDETGRRGSFLSTRGAFVMSSGGGDNNNSSSNSSSNSGGASTKAIIAAELSTFHKELLEAKAKDKGNYEEALKQVYAIKSAQDKVRRSGKEESASGTRQLQSREEGILRPCFRLVPLHVPEITQKSISEYLYSILTPSPRRTIDIRARQKK